jgi:drug/metabolite transporter (DMT)-like permease
MMRTVAANKVTGRGGLAAVMMSAVFWSTAGIFIKLLDWNPILIAGGRSLVASLVLLAFIRRPRFSFSLPQIGAAVSYAANMLLFVVANKTTTPANAVLLMYTAPIFAALFGLVLIKERPSAAQWAGLVAVIAGIVVFFADRVASGQAIGNILAIGSGLAFGLFSVFMRMQKDGSPLESSLLANMIMVLIGIGAAPFVPFPRLAPVSIAAVLLLGTVQLGFASVFFSIGIKGVTAMQSMLIATLEPILNPLWVFIFSGEKPSANTFAGGSIIIASVVVSSALLNNRKN